ncbi:hypothetical protein IL308_09875 [Lactococcus lactis]|uniref:hypothetical protein n=1 Tax=Lactococcus lactis TaxID=1358 RepID=UPI0019141FA8|nr:hypothetical protein [Lactococcus lactis]MBK5077065.1 hypothetical protein [Lactococcus lactis]
MSYYRICPNCGKGAVARYATDDSLCGECSDNSSDNDKLSVEKLQEQLNSKVKALTEIRANIEEHNQIYDLSTSTALLLEGIDGIAFEALEMEEGNE